MATGWGRLGEMLVGGGGGDEAYRARMMDNARLGTAMGQDRALRLKEAALLGLDEALVGMGNSAEQSRGLGTLGRAGLNPEQFTSAGIELGTRRAQDAAFEAVASGGGIGEANAYLALQQGKPVATVDIKGDTVFNPYGPLDQALVTTELGQARIGERNAAAGAQNALAWKRNTEASFVGSGGSGGATNPDGTPAVQYEGPVMTGPRGIILTSTGNKTLDKELYVRSQADLEIIDTINDIRAVSQDERNFGAVGGLRSTMQDLIQQGNATAQQFGGRAAEIRDEIESGAADVDMGMFSTDLPAITFYNNVLAFMLAKSLDPSGRISNDDVKRAAAAIGNPQSMLGNREKYMTALDSMEAQAQRRLEQSKPRQIGAPLGDALAAPTGRLDPSSAARVIADIEAERGAPLTPEQRQQALQQLTTGAGQMDMAIPPPRRTLDQMPISEVGGGAIGAPAPVKRRIRYDAQGNVIQ